MHPVTQNIGAFAAGMGVTTILIGAIKALGEQLKRALKDMPFRAYMIVELAYIVGSFGGGFAVSYVAASYHLQLALGFGALLTLFGFQSQVCIPFPLWFAVLTTITFIPMSWVGWRAWKWQSELQTSSTRTESLFARDKETNDSDCIANQVNMLSRAEQ